MAIKPLHLIKSFFAPRLCDICQRPLLDGESNICCSCNVMVKGCTQLDDSDNPIARMFWGFAPIHKAGVLFDYQAETPVSELLVDMKYRGYADACQRLGRALGSYYQPRHFFDGVDVIIPVPLSAQRFRERGFNQSLKIAQGIAEMVDIPIDSQNVRRIVDNQTQTHLTQSERMANVDQIFVVSNPEALNGKHILVVDDVVTTGATISSLIRSVWQVAPGTSFSILAVGRGSAGNIVQIPNKYHPS